MGASADLNGIAKTLVKLAQSRRETWQIAVERVLSNIMEGIYLLIVIKIVKAVG